MERGAGKNVTISKNARRENVYYESISRHFVIKGRLRTYSCIYVHFLKLKWGDCFGFRKNKQLCGQEWSTFIFKHFCRTLLAQRELLLSTAAKYCDHGLLSFVLEFGVNWWTVRVLFFCYSVAALAEYLQYYITNNYSSGSFIFNPNLRKWKKCTMGLGLWGKFRALWWVLVSNCLNKKLTQK